MLIFLVPLQFNQGPQFDQYMLVRQCCPDKGRRPLNFGLAYLQGLDLTKIKEYRMIFDPAGRKTT